MQTGNRVSAFLMHRQLFESTFNELYHLGQIEHPAISLHYDDYPHIRIYKLEGAPAGCVSSRVNPPTSPHLSLAFMRK